jgi:hypothetical protein
MAPVPSNLTLGALGLSLADTIGTTPPLQQPPAAGGPLTLEQLGLSLQDTTSIVDEDNHAALASALERVERPDQRMRRIATTFGAAGGPGVSASADFVLIDDVQDQVPRGRDS